MSTGLTEVTTQVSSFKQLGGKEKCMTHKQTILKTINVSEQNYFALKALGQAGDSFNDVLSRLLAGRTK